MSAYSTLEITREEAERMVVLCRLKSRKDVVSTMSNRELDQELHKYVYSEDYDDIVGCLHNYIIKD